MPQRIQRKRTKGWRKPDGAIIVSRPSEYGNPFVVGMEYNEGEYLCDTAQEAVELYERMLARFKRSMPSAFEEWIAPLRGHDLCCYCKAGEPCHADVLLMYANEGAEDE